MRNRPYQVLKCSSASSYTYFKIGSLVTSRPLSLGIPMLFTDLVIEKKTIWCCALVYERLRCEPWPWGWMGGASHHHL